MPDSTETAGTDEEKDEEKSATGPTEGTRIAGTSERLPTPDRLLHTGSEHPVDPEDLVRLSGREPTPARLERARRKLDEDGAAAVERYLP